jgi:hypothetical protein
MASSGMLHHVDVVRATRRNIPEDGILHMEIVCIASGYTAQSSHLSSSLYANKGTNKQTLWPLVCK